VLDSLHLTLLIGRTIPVPAPAVVMQALKSVQVTVGSGQRSGFQLAFALSKRSPLTNELIPLGYFDPGNRVIIVATVGAIPNVLIDGIITRQEVSASNDLGQSQVSVTGEDVSVMMDLNDVVPKPFPAVPVAGQVAILIGLYAIYGLVPLVIPPIFSSVKPPTDAIPFQKGSDLAYINYLAKKAGYVFFIEPGPLPGMNIAYFGPEIRIGIPQPALNVNMDALTNVNSLSFSFDGLSRKQYAILIQEPNTKIGIPIPLPNLDILSPPLTLKQAPSLRFETLPDAAKLNPVEALGQGLAKAIESSDAVSGSGEVDVLRYGQPLKARCLVGVRGAGLAYDGLYYVKSVTHNIKASEYKQSFTLARNGLIPLTPVVVP
jgi:hypothetical protein